MHERKRRPPPIHCRERLLGGAARLLGSREAAEDVVQEALLRYLQRPGPAPDVPHAWLARVCANLAIDRLRRLRLERAEGSAQHDGAAFVRASVSTPDDELERGERCREAIRRLLDGSTPRDVAAVLLREVFGTDYADIARVRGRGEAVSRQAVRRALERARGGARERDEARARKGAASGDTPRAGTRADAVLERFAHAVLDADPRPLFDALRVAASDADADVRASDGLASHAARLRFDIDADGARISLTLGGVTLCEIVRPSPRGALRRAEPTSGASG